MEKLATEWVVAAMAVGLALLPIAARIGRTRPHLRRYAMAIPVAAFLAVLVVALRRPIASIPEQQVTDRPVEIPTAGYATSSTCQACHPENYASWYNSYHRTMTQIASPESIAAGPESWQFNYGNNHYTVANRNGELWVGSDDSAWRAVEARPADERTRPFIERPVVLVTGSHHEQVYWVPFGERSLGMFPMLYRIEEQRWVPYTGVFLTPGTAPPPFVTGRWNMVCMRCHTTNPRPGAQNATRMNTQVSEWGIACEACHGPGLEHAETNRDPERRYRMHLGDGSDPTIVNPARLTAQRSAQVCGSCHSVHVAPNPAVALADTQDGSRFRPGDDLDAMRHVVRASHDALPSWAGDVDPHFFEDRFWADGRPSVTGREYNGVSTSPCYAGEEFSCVSCHQLHERPEDPRPVAEWADNQLAVGMDGDAACLQCHSSLGDDLVAHTHHPADSVGSRCYNCHMPNTEYGLLKASRSHQVSVPTTRETLDVGRPNACNLCHLDRTLAWTGDQLETWYGTPAPERTDPERDQTADAVWMLLRGDAGQRALVAWHMGWAPAREASGEDWIAPLLAQLLEDPYLAVRSIAYRSLRTLPGFADVEFDEFDSEQKTRATKWKIWEIWERERTHTTRVNPSQVLMRANGGLDRSRFDRLLAERDDRRVFRAE